VRQAIARLGSSKLGPTSTPTFLGVTTTSLTISGLTTNSLIYPVSGLLTSLGVAANGQIPIGSTGTTPVLANITATANQITVTNGTGTIALSFPNPLVIPGKLTAGSFGSPTDVTGGGQYGFELHYSGNNYNVTGVRSRAQLITTDTTASATGGLFQAANNDDVNVGVLNGFVAEAIGKATANAATITMMRGGLIGGEWSAKDTVTDYRNLHLRTHTRDAATEGYISGTGYSLLLENEAVGGNGQALDAGIYFKGTNLSAGNKAFDYGIDFSGATYGTAELKLSNGSIIGSDKVTLKPNANSTTFLQVMNAAGTAISLNIDTTNSRVGFGTNAPLQKIHLKEDDPQIYFEDTLGGAKFSTTLGHVAGNFRLYDETNTRSVWNYTASSNIFLVSAQLVSNTNSGTTPFWVTRLGVITQGLSIYVDDNSVYFESVQDENTPTYGNMIFRADDDGTADGFFAFQGKSATEYMRILGRTGYVGFNEVAPETLIELTHATPVITGHASTHSDADESGLFEITGKREDGAGTETESGHIKMWHDGAGVNDQLTKMTLGVNTGSGVVDALTLDSDLLATFGGSLSVPVGSKIGIGTPNPTGEIEVSTNTSSTLRLNVYSTTNAVGAAWVSRKSNSNTIGTVVQTDSGDSLGSFFFLGVSTGNFFASAASIVVMQAGVSGGGSVPATMEFNTYGSSRNDNQLFLDGPTGYVGVGVIPTLPLDIKAKSGNTTIGGFAIKMTNKTGVASVAGKVVECGGAVDDAVALSVAGGDHSIGVFLDSGIADGSEAWIVVGGVADVLYEDGESSTRDQWVFMSGTAGFAQDQAATPGHAADHWKEIGHCCETVTYVDTPILARCILHFN
jgi:hypothetical protein